MRRSYDNIHNIDICTYSDSKFNSTHHIRNRASFDHASNKDNKLGHNTNIRGIDSPLLSQRSSNRIPTNPTQYQTTLSPQQTNKFGTTDTTTMLKKMRRDIRNTLSKQLPNPSLFKPKFASSKLPTKLKETSKQRFVHPSHTTDTHSSIVNRMNNIMKINISHTSNNNRHHINKTKSLIKDIIHSLGQR